MLEGPTYADLAESSVSMRIFFVIALLSLSTLDAHASSLSPEESKISTWVDAHRAEAERFLEEVVNINSGTMNLNGVRKVGDLFKREFEKIGFTTRWISMPEEMKRAGHLFAEYNDADPKVKRILYIGHLDTVFEKESSFQKFRRVDDQRVTGPGVSDMKSGDVAILFALRALKETGVLKNAKIIVALMGDEEKIGVPLDIARKDLIDAARTSDVALAFESGTKDLKAAAIARRGFSGWTLKTTGRQGHSAQVYSTKAGDGAIYEAARILNEIRTTFQTEKYLTINPGIVLGGTDVAYDPDSNRGTSFGKSNVISRDAILTGDLRALSEGQREKAKKKMVVIAERNLPVTSASFEFRDVYPPMPPTDGNRRLLRLLSDVSGDLGQGKVREEDPGKRGAADASFVAPYVSVVDGLGGGGGEEHSDREFLSLDTLANIVKRTAILTRRLTLEAFRR